MDYIYNFDQEKLKTLPATIENNALKWPEITLNADDTVLLRLKTTVKPCGKFLFPHLRITNNKKTTDHYCERNNSGVKYFNITNIAHSSTPTEIIKLSGHHISYTSQAELLIFSHKFPANATTLVIAPHPDDAELAAFAFYSDHDSHLVTISGGENCETSIPNIYSESAIERQQLVAKLRTASSMVPPLLSNIPPQHLNYFNYPDGNFSNLDPLSKDLCKLLQKLKPQLIILPHPVLDKNPDHRRSTLAALKAVKECGLQNGTFMFYIIHSSYSHKYPYGPQGNPVTLPPNQMNFAINHGVYSYPVIAKQQIVKTYALDSIYGLRATPNHLCTIKQVITQKLRKFLGNYGRMTPYYNYFRKFVRSNELFLTSPFAATELLIKTTENQLKSDEAK